MVPDIKKNVISNTVVNVDYTRIESESSISIGLGDDDNGNGNDDDDDDDDDDEYEVDMISITDSRHNSNINVNHPFFHQEDYDLVEEDDDDDDDDDDDTGNKKESFGMKDLMVCIQFFLKFSMRLSLLFSFSLFLIKQCPLTIFSFNVL